MTNANDENEGDPMASLSERNQEVQLKKEKKRRRRKVVLTTALCIAAAAGLFIYIVDSMIDKNYEGYEVVSTVHREDSNSVHYQSFQNNILKYSRDGASCLSPDGTTLWNGSYEMANPVADMCGSYAIVADIGGKEVYVYDGMDSGTVLTEVHPIVQAKVAGQGVTAVLIQDGASNEIHVYNPYDKNKKLLFTIPSDAGEDGYPVDIAISPDGKKLITSYISVSNGVTRNKVTFYNLGEVGKSKTNFIVGALDLEQEICPKISFINNDTVCLYGEQGFQIYTMPELPEKVSKVVFEKEIKSVMRNNQYLGFILMNYSDSNKYQLLIYDLKGKKILDQPLNLDYETVYFTDNELILYSELSIYMVRFDGSEKLSCHLDRRMEYIFPAGKKDRYILIDANNIYSIRLTGAKRKK